MRISDIINEDSVEIAAEFGTKDDALIRLAQLHREQGNIYDPQRFINDIRESELKSCGAVSGRIAITALSDRTARDSRITAMTVKDGIEYGAPDRRPVKLIFLIAGRNNSDEYQKVKTRLISLLNDPGYSARLCCAKDKREFIELLNEREKTGSAPPQPGKEYESCKIPIRNNKRQKRRLALFAKPRFRILRRFAILKNR